MSYLSPVSPGSTKQSFDSPAQIEKVLSRLFVPPAPSDGTNTPRTAHPEHYTKFFRRMLEIDLTEDANPDVVMPLRVLQGWWNVVNTEWTKLPAKSHYSPSVYVHDLCDAVGTVNAKAKNLRKIGPPHMKDGQLECMRECYYWHAMITGGNADKLRIVPELFLVKSAAAAAAAGAGAGSSHASSAAAAAAGPLNPARRIDFSRIDLTGDDDDDSATIPYVPIAIAAARADAGPVRSRPASPQSTDEEDEENDGDLPYDDVNSMSEGEPRSMDEGEPLAGAGLKRAHTFSSPSVGKRLEKVSPSAARAAVARAGRATLPSARKEREKQDARSVSRARQSAAAAGAGVLRPHAIGDVAIPPHPGVHLAALSGSAHAAERDRLVAENARLNAQHSEAQEKYERLKKSYDEIEERNRAGNVRVEELLAQTQKLARLFEDAVARADGIETEYTRVLAVERKTIAGLESRVVQEGREKEAARNEQSTAMRLLGEAQARAASLQNAAGDSELRLLVTNANLVTSERRVADLLAQLQDSESRWGKNSDEQVASLTAQLIAKRQQWEALDIQFQQLSQEHTHCEHLKRVSAQQIADLQSENAQWKSEVTRLNSIITSGDARALQQGVLHGALQADHGALLQRFAILEAETKRLRTAVAAAPVCIEPNAGLQQEITRLREQLANSVPVGASGDIAALRNQLAGLQEQLSLAQTENGRLREETSAHVGHITYLKGKLDELEGGETNDPFGFHPAERSEPGAGFAPRHQQQPSEEGDIESRYAAFQKKQARAAKENDEKALRYAQVQKNARVAIPTQGQARYAAQLMVERYFGGRVKESGQRNREAEQKEEE